MTIPAGVTLEPTRFYSSIVLGGGRIVYKVVLQDANGEELYKIGETPQDKEAIKNLDVDLFSTHRAVSPSRSTVR